MNTHQRRTAHRMVRLCRAGWLALGLCCAASLAQAQPRPLLPDQPNASSGGVIQPVSPNPPGASPPAPPVPNPPPVAPGNASPICQLPMQARTPDLRAYCAARGQ